jgi:hypothetical protein
MEVPTYGGTYIWRYLHLLFIQIFSTLHFINIIVIVRIITISVTNFYRPIYFIKGFRRYLSSVLPIYRTLNAAAISILGVRELSYLGRISEMRLEVLR